LADGVFADVVERTDRAPCCDYRDGRCRGQGRRRVRDSRTPTGWLLAREPEPRCDERWFVALSTIAASRLSGPTGTVRDAPETGDSTRPGARDWVTSDRAALVYGQPYFAWVRRATTT